MKERFFSHQYKLLLGLVLLAGFFIRAVNLNFNSPFLDEAIYINLGRQFWSGNWSSLSESISWVGGFPFFYPPLAAAFFAFGGIVTSRFLNVILGVASAYLIYKFTYELFPIEDKKQRLLAGIIAAALMATSAIPIVYSRQTMLDNLSIFLFLAGSLFLARAIYEGERDSYIRSAISLFGAFLAKYIAVIYIPLLLILTLYLATRTGKKYILEGIFKSFWLPLVLLTLVFVSINFESLTGFFASKTSGHSGSFFGIIWSYLKYSPLIFAASVPSIYFIIKKKATGLALILSLGALLPLFAHITIGEGSSVHQHSVFALLFLLPTIGIASGSLINKYKYPAVLAIGLFIFLNFIISMPKVKALETFWPNTNEAVKFLRSDVVPGDQVLAESEDSIALGLSNKLPQENIEGPFDFTYRNLKGVDAYQSAVNDGYFNYIELDKTFFSSDEYLAIESVIEKNYSLVFDDGSIRILKIKNEKI